MLRRAFRLLPRHTRLVTSAQDAGAQLPSTDARQNLRDEVARLAADPADRAEAARVLAEMTHAKTQTDDPRSGPQRPIIAATNPPLLVACPTCGADPWKRCRTRGGRPRATPHVARRRPRSAQRRTQTPLATSLGPAGRRLLRAVEGASAAAPHTGIGGLRAIRRSLVIRRCKSERSRVDENRSPSRPPEPTTCRCRGQRSRRTPVSSRNDPFGPATRH